MSELGSLDPPPDWQMPLTILVVMARAMPNREKWSVTIVGVHSFGTRNADKLSKTRSNDIGIEFTDKVGVELARDAKKSVSLWATHFWAAGERRSGKGGIFGVVGSGEVPSIRACLYLEGEAIDFFGAISGLEETRRKNERMMKRKKHKNNTNTTTQK
ncbi:hypothetical protein M9H77_25514 [Catharanthus roseus]|uniref:Uncharacterized protein n=1 Tax=Catharanthus roseus TaxID=4058 RepID=A0ACC0A803_CATRO|nr:hypothetical protein M9H77_25514 [Catharanthus roseus]